MLSREAIKSTYTKQAGPAGSPIIDVRNFDYDRSGIDIPKQATPVKNNLVKVHVRPGNSTSSALVPLHKATDISTLVRLISFFKQFAGVNLSNLTIAQQAFLNFFAHADNYENQFRLLTEELDKHCSRTDTFGKVVLCSTISYAKPGYKRVKISIKRSSSKMQNIEQQISFNFSSKNHDRRDYLVFTKITGKHARTELLRARKFESATEANKEQLAIDASIWKSFVGKRVSPKHYNKLLESLERQHLFAGSLFRAINKRSITELMQKDLLQKISIKSNKRNSSKIKFGTRTNQKIEIKVAPSATAIIVK